MDAKTLAALRGSIAKWEGIVAGEIEDNGGDNCPLCQMFNPNPRPSTMSEAQACLGCPVRDRSGEKYCRDTPYADIEDVGEEYGENSEEYQEVAQRELKFLKSLLPQAEVAVTTGKSET